LTEDALAQRLHAIGISPRQGRSTALFTLAAEVPAAILAKTLGIHVQAAIQWQKISAGDWTAYAADVSRRRAWAALAGTVGRRSAPAGSGCRPGKTGRRRISSWPASRPPLARLSSIHVKVTGAWSYVCAGTGPAIPPTRPLFGNGLDARTGPTGACVATSMTSSSHHRTTATCCARSTAPDRDRLRITRPG
jgi:hypothetical protein